MASFRPSPLTQDSDFAAELLLNRIMNGQVEPESGKTVTAANRVLASSFDQTAASYGVIAENVAYGQGIVEGTQNALTELMHQVESLRKLCTSAQSAQEAQSLAGAVQQNIDDLLATQIEGITVLGNSGKSISIGEGANETLRVGEANVNAGGTAFNTLYSNLSSITPSSAETLCSAAIEELQGAIANQGAQYAVLANRYDLLNDLASTYHKASDDEAKQQTASASTLLDIVM